MMGENDSGENEEDFKLRELPYPFEKELAEKQNKQRPLFDTFISTVKVSPIIVKFHTRHEQDPVKDVKSYQKYLAIAYGIKRFDQPHEVPCLESQLIGWIPSWVDRKKLGEIKALPKFNRRCDFTVFAEKTFCDQITQRPKFVGLSFLLR